jgi:hypothetical protein
VSKKLTSNGKNMHGEEKQNNFIIKAAPKMVKVIFYNHVALHLDFFEIVHSSYRKNKKTYASIFFNLKNFFKRIPDLSQLRSRKK